MIGLWGDDLAWQELLRQEGVPFCTNCYENISAANVLILDRPPRREELKTLVDYTNRGGALLTYAGNISSLWPTIRLRRRKLRYMLPDDSGLFRNVGIVHLTFAGIIPEGANAGLTPTSDKAVFYGSYGNSKVVILPFDPALELRTIASAIRIFPGGTRRPVFEKVSRISRGEIRRLVANALRWLSFAQGLPYFRLSFFPEGNSALAVRVDTDASSLSSLQVAAKTARDNGLCFSWFVHVQAAGQHLSKLVEDTLKGQDIQLHCFSHNVYPDYESNFRDVSQGISLLKSVGIHPTGIAAPYGKWSEDWSRAVADAGLKYSSEFSVDYDDVPFRPIIQGQPSRVLQVPVHPICLGRLSAARATATQILAYFRSVIDRQVARQEPCLLYDHPAAIDRYEDVWREIISYARSNCDICLSLSSYAEWWLRREVTKWQVLAETDSCEVATAGPNPSVQVIIEREDRWSAINLETGIVKYDQLIWQKKKTALFRLSELRRTINVGLRVRYQEALRRLWQCKHKEDK